MYYICVAIELIAVFVCYSVAIYGISKFGKKGFRGLMLIFAAATLLKYCCKTAVNWSYEGAIPLLWYMDLIDAVYFTALEFVQFIIVWAVASRIVSGRSENMPSLRFEKLYDRENPLMRAALWSSIIVVAVRFLLAVIDDALTIVMYGLPERIETIILMVISYISTLIFGAICYLITVFTVSKLVEKDSQES